VSVEVAQRMTGFGETLRKEREARGVALETITKITKISNRHLVALEREQFQSLPGGVFNKGIVRGYARVVGLNEEEWVDRYLSAYQSSGAAPDDESDWVQFAENASKGREAARGRRPDMRLRWTGVAMLLLVLTGLSWFVWGFVHRKVAANSHSAPVHHSVPNESSSGGKSR
jgi:cytoskeleton protein RodZ